eukprot:gb/GEZJ01004526.1/.p2 GENE.gb/GEZJ01004526.1/~~gb/GEZJ01004526.1/.p2  ORF type:complete len:454 (-),score=59.99 gb/GEZJ01004526.1/:1808-3169(-)
MSKLGSIALSHCHVHTLAAHNGCQRQPLNFERLSFPAHVCYAPIFAICASCRSIVSVSTSAARHRRAAPPCTAAPTMSRNISGGSSRQRSRASSSTPDVARRPPSRSNTVYYDALGIPFDSSSRDISDVNIASLSAADLPAEPVPTTAGARPHWGWDYVFVFRLPRALKRQLAADAADAADPADGPAIKRAELAAAAEGRPNDALHQEEDEEEEDGKSAQRLRERVEILARLNSAGFVFSQLLVPSEQLIFLRLSLPLDGLKQAAQHVGMELQLKPEYGGGYLVFAPHREHVYVNHEMEKSSGCYFAPADRSLLIMNVLQSKEHWGCGLNIERLLFEKKVEQAFALHSMVEKRRLVKEVVWRQWWNPIRRPPFQELKDYLGGSACDVLFCVCELLCETVTSACTVVHSCVCHLSHGEKRRSTGDYTMGVFNWIGSMDHILFGELEAENCDGEH